MIFEVIAWAIVLSVVSNMFYRKGIKSWYKTFSSYLESYTRSSEYIESRIEERCL